MTLDKRLVDEVIRLTKKYYRTGDEDYLPALKKAEKVLEESVSWRVVRITQDLAKYIQTSDIRRYLQKEQALAIFRIIVEDKEKE